MRRSFAEQNGGRGLDSFKTKNVMGEDNNYLTPNEQLQEHNKILRVEIDRLRLRNQMLRMEIEHAQEFRCLIYQTLKTIWLKFRRKISSKLKLRVLKTSFTGRRDDDTHSESFKPYQVRRLYPPHSSRPRVVHFIANFEIGGSARLVVDLLEHLGHKYQQEIVTRYLPEPPSYVGKKIHAYDHATSISRLISYLEKFKPDIIHVHYWGGIDWQWYNKVFQAAEAYGGKIIENVNVPVEPYVSDTVNRYVYVSNRVKAEFGRLDCYNLTIYPGSDFNHFQKRNEAKLPDNCIGMVYRLEPDKLDEHSIDAFIKVTQRRQGTKALIVGGGCLLKVYQEAVQRAGVGDAFTFTGYVSYEDLPSLYEQMSVFVAPVCKESFGQVVPFAMNMGLAVTGYNVGALEEIIGDNKLLAPPGESEKLADLIVELLDDRETRLRIGMINRQRAPQVFSVEAMISSYDDLYNKLLEVNEQRTRRSSGSSLSVADRRT